MSFATVRLESGSLTPEQLIELVVGAVRDSSGVDVHIVDQGVVVARSFS